MLYIGTQLAATLVTAISADPTQRRIMFALPFVFTVFIINFEAGLIVYWITTNVWTIGQQLLVRKLYPEAAAARAREDDGAGARQAGPRQTAGADADRDDGGAARRQGARRRRRRRRRPARAAGAGNGAPRQAAALAAQEEEALRPPAVGGRRMDRDPVAEAHGRAASARPSGPP